MLDNQMTKYRTVTKDCPDCAKGRIYSMEALHNQLWMMHPVLSVIKAQLKEFKLRGSAGCLRCGGEGIIETMI